MAKKFFYVCAGLCLLALSYHFGASTATAQATGQVYFAGVGGASAAVSGRTIYVLSPAYNGPTAFPEAVPGSAEIASVLVYNAGYTTPATTVVLANGDTYHWSGVVQHWVFAGSFAGTTQAHLTSWGSLKVGQR